LKVVLDPNVIISALLSTGTGGVQSPV